MFEITIEQMSLVRVAFIVAELGVVVIAIDVSWSAKLCHNYQPN